MSSSSLVAGSSDVRLGSAADRFDAVDERFFIDRADVPTGDHAVRTDEEGLGDAEDAIGESGVPVGVDDARPGVAHTRDVISRGLEVVLVDDPDQDHIAGSIAFPDANECGVLLFAGDAPGSPKVDYHDLALIRGEAQAPRSVEAIELEDGRGLADGSGLDVMRLPSDAEGQADPNTGCGHA